MAIVDLISGFSLLVLFSSRVIAGMLIALNLPRVATLINYLLIACDNFLNADAGGEGRG